MVKAKHFFSMRNHASTTRVLTDVQVCRQSKAETCIYMARNVGYRRWFECSSALCKPFIIAIHQLVMHHFFPPQLASSAEKSEETRYCLYWLQSELHKSNVNTHSLDGYKGMKFHLRLAFLELLTLHAAGLVVLFLARRIQQMTVLERTIVNVL